MYFVHTQKFLKILKIVYEICIFWGSSRLEKKKSSVHKCYKVVDIKNYVCENGL